MTHLRDFTYMTSKCHDQFPNCSALSAADMLPDVHHMLITFSSFGAECGATSEAGEASCAGATVCEEEVALWESAQL